MAFRIVPCPATTSDGAKCLGPEGHTCDHEFAPPNPRDAEIARLKGEVDSYHLLNGVLEAERDALTARLAEVEAALELTADDHLILGRDETGALMGSLFCSDTFAYACADAEDITFSEMPEMLRRVRAEGWPAAVRWIAERRKVEPLPQVRKMIRSHDKELAAVRTALAEAEQARDITREALDNATDDLATARASAEEWKEKATAMYRSFDGHVYVKNEDYSALCDDRRAASRYRAALARIADDDGDLDEARRLYLRSAEEPCECDIPEHGCPSCSTFAKAERIMDRVEKQARDALTPDAAPRT